MRKHRRMLKIAVKIGAAWDGLRQLLRLGTGYPATVQAYRGFGGRDFVVINGRVLREKHIRRSDKDKGWLNFVKTMRRLNSREINYAKLDIEYDGRVFPLQSNSEGYFRLFAQLEPPLQKLQTEDDEHWHEARITLKSIPGQRVNVTCTTEVLVPDKAVFGVISDIDDTILQTYVTSWLKWRMIYLTLLKNAVTRQAFPHTAAFFQSLRRGPKGGDYNPFFYVSNSPWNLYDLLEEFLELNKLPRGPILLRDFGFPYEQIPTDYKGHKHEQILQIFQRYPDLPFILVGDSGEKDVDIYHAIATAHPERVLAIYIRDVGDRARARRVQAILDSLWQHPTLLIRDYQQAAEHAATIGLLNRKVFWGFE